jgi:hypothetical protein
LVIGIALFAIFGILWVGYMAFIIAIIGNGEGKPKPKPLEYKL